MKAPTTRKTTKTTQSDKPRPRPGNKNVASKIPGRTKALWVDAKARGIVMKSDASIVPIVPRTGETPEVAKARVVAKHPGKVYMF